MFTGIVEELGTVKAIHSLQTSARLTIAATKVLEGTIIGDSIAVNGVCLTVTEMSSKDFSADVMYETLRKTNLEELKQHSNVNLERALQLQSRLGGHLVSGHVDGIGTIRSISPVGIAKVLKIHCEEHVARNLLPKGSVSIDGISLTVVDVEDAFFTVSIIPHTLKNTTLGYKNIGLTVNLETDIIGKYVANFMKLATKSSKHDISYDFLAEHGYI